MKQMCQSVDHWKTANQEKNHNENLPPRYTIIFLLLLYLPKLVFQRGDRFIQIVILSLHLFMATK